AKHDAHVEVNTPLRELGEQRKLSERQPVDDVAVGTVDAHRIGGQPPGHPALADLPRMVVSSGTNRRTWPVSPSARAVSRTVAAWFATSHGDKLLVAPAPEWSCSACASASAASGSAAREVSIGSALPPSQVIVRSTLFPAKTDQVIPVAESPSMPTNSQAPSTPCRLSTLRRRPSLFLRPVRARFRAMRHHRNSPPRATTHIQLAASSEYSSPTSPRCRFLCVADIQWRSGSSPRPE